MSPRSLSRLLLGSSPVLYAKVVLGLPVDGPFDYLVPVNLEEQIKIGARIWVNFRNKKEVAYVVGLSNKTTIKKLKEISTIMDLAVVASYFEDKIQNKEIKDINDFVKDISWRDVFKRII